MRIRIADAAAGTMPLYDRSARDMLPNPSEFDAVASILIMI
jgi:hypothetical protein